MSTQTDRFLGVDVTVEVEIDVYVPNIAASDGLRRDTVGIDPGSGIVGRASGPNHLLIDYEGNRFGAANIVTYADRVAHAADRQVRGYPTLARRVVRCEAFWHVARFLPDYGVTFSRAETGEALATSAVRAGLRVFRVARWIGLVEEASELGDEVSERLARELRVSS